MIFITVGTTKFPFERLLRAVDEVLMKLGSKEKLIAQVGCNHYKFQYSKTSSFCEVPFPQMIKYLKKADLIIAHGGLGTAVLSLNYAKNKPLLIPRLRKFNEHIDNHQVCFVNYLVEKKQVIGTNQEKLTKSIKSFLATPQKNYFRGNRNSQILAKKLLQYTNSLQDC